VKKTNWEGFSKIVDASPGFFQEEMFFRKLSTADYQFNYEKATGAGTGS
jgi:hypothetical protein